MSKKYKCIIVDDDPTSLAIIHSLINRTEDLELVGQFINPVDATLEIHRLKPDIVFLDLNMPYITGEEVMELSEVDTKYIIISGSEEDPSLAEEFQYSAYLQKPILSFEYFEEAVKKVITG